MADKYKVKITKSGYIYIAITILISVAAINTGNNLLYIISSLMLALMALSGLTSLANLMFIDIRLEPPAELFAEIPARFKLLVNKKLGGSFFLHFETPFGSVPLPYIKDSSEQSLWLAFPNRGKIRLENLQIHSGFPLGFFRRSKRVDVDLELIVYPRPKLRSMPVPTGGIRGHEKASDSSFGERGDEIKELRKYRASDPLKWVEWKATARRGRMMVREFYHLEGDTLHIDLSGKGKNWENRLSEACHLVLEGFRRRLRIAITLPDKEIGPGGSEAHKNLLLEALALA
ncbi:MAG: DUF58 domain-containing protein [Deltaproteobacteria bacterium]|nr:DUF58 domain-containing protein [Deltaproteobacteria bacterium]